MPKFQIGSIQREQKDKIGFLEGGGGGKREGRGKKKRKRKKKRKTIKTKK